MSIALRFLCIASPEATVDQNILNIFNFNFGKTSDLPAQLKCKSFNLYMKQVRLNIDTIDVRVFGLLSVTCTNDRS